MIVFLYITSFVINTIGVVKENKILIFDILTLLIISFLLGRGANTPDTYNYYIGYVNSLHLNLNETFEPGYLILQKISHYFKLDYVSFRLLLSFLCFLLIRSTIIKFTSNPHFVYLYFLLFLIFINTEQIRNFFAFSIIVYGFRFLINNSLRGKIKYLVTVLLACTIHITSLIYIIFIFVSFKNRKYFIRLIVITTLFLCIFIYIGGNNLSFIREIINSFDSGSGKYDAYIEGQTKLGFLYAFLLHFYNIYIVSYSRNILKASNLDTNKNAFVELIYWINLISIVFFPLFMLNLQFIRLVRNLLIVNYIVFSFLPRSSVKLKRKSIYIQLMILINTFLWFYYTFIIQDHIDDILIPFFDNSIFSS